MALMSFILTRPQTLHDSLSPRTPLPRSNYLILGPSPFSLAHRRTQPTGSEPGTGTLPKISVINLHRPIMSRNHCDMFHLRTTLAACDVRIDGVGGCFGLCRAPSSLPWCAHICLCCAYPRELEDARRDSSYLIIRDNSVEFNNPKVRERDRLTLAPTGTCFQSHLDSDRRLA